MDSVLLTSPQTRKLDSIHYKSLRRILKTKYSFYHRVLEPSTAECSNQCLASLSYRCRKIITPSKLYSQERFQLFGHIHRHPESVENKCTYISSHVYRHIRAPNRSGRPEIHCDELCMTQAAQRIDRLLSNAAPTHDQITHAFYDIPTHQDITSAHGSSGLVWMDNTSLFRRVHPRCQDRQFWAKVAN